MSRSRPAATYERHLAAARAAGTAGDTAAALAHAAAAVRLHPGGFEGHFVEAVTLQRAGRFAEAIAAYDRAIAADGGVAEAHHHRGRALLMLRRFDEAIDALQRALGLRPQYAEALDAAGYAAAELGALDEAIAFFVQSLRVDARDAAVHARLGNALLLARRDDDARRCFEAALAIAPGSAELLAGLGVALERAGESDAAIARYREALARDPQLAIAACNLGKALVAAGEPDEAMTWFDRAIALDPRNGSFYLPLVTGGSRAIAAAHVSAMLDLGRDVDALPPDQQIDLHFALANVHERAGCVDEAFHHLVEGNRRKRARIRYDEPAARASVALLSRAFDEAALDELGACGDPSGRPIFIVGMPRSGSTLVEQLLAAHPAVDACGEAGLLGPLVRASLPALTAAATPSERRAIVRAIGAGYVHATDGLARAGRRLADKTLENVQLLPLIAAALPNARVVHVRRDDLDCCFSCFATAFDGDRVPFSYDLGELGRFYGDYLRMMERERARFDPGRVIEISYERLVDDFAGEARRIVEFCGLPWDPACLQFHRVRRPVRTASNLQVRQPLYRDSVGRARPFTAHLAPLIAAFSG